MKLFERHTIKWTYSYPNHRKNVSKSFIKHVAFAGAIFVALRVTAFAQPADDSPHSDDFKKQSDIYFADVAEQPPISCVYRIRQFPFIEDPTGKPAGSSVRIVFDGKGNMRLEYPFIPDELPTEITWFNGVTCTTLVMRKESNNSNAVINSISNNYHTLLNGHPYLGIVYWPIRLFELQNVINRPVMRSEVTEGADGQRTVRQVSSVTGDIEITSYSVTPYFQIVSHEEKRGHGELRKYNYENKLFDKVYIPRVVQARYTGTTRDAELHFEAVLESDEILNQDEANSLLFPQLPLGTTVRDSTSNSEYVAGEEPPAVARVSDSTGNRRFDFRYLSAATLVVVGGISLFFLQRHSRKTPNEES